MYKYGYRSTRYDRNCNEPSKDDGTATMLKGTVEADTMLKVKPRKDVRLDD